MSRPKSELIRINGDAQERGCYVCNDPKCMEKLLKNRKLNSPIREALERLYEQG